MEKVSASIVVYKTEPQLLERAINSFLQSSITGRLTVLDNSPTDELRRFCSPETEYHFNNKNLGYGSAHNLALRANLDRSKYHVVLNPDVCFDENVIERLFHFMESQPQAGLVMPKIYNDDGQAQMMCKLLPSPLNLAARRFNPFERLFKKLNERYEMKECGYDRVLNVPFLSGCFMFLRNAALRDTGLFDERFFLYAEDTDLSRRIHQQYETLFFPDVSITHVHARGSYKSFNLTIENLKSAIQYFNKWGWFFDAERELINEQALLQTKEINLPRKTLTEAEAAVA